ncbi:MAG TPA: acylphosphatase, partial [Pirellulales bacterium]
VSRRVESGPMGSKNDQRSTVYYSGNVQGVGFRFTARSIARGFAVTGYVENLPDGRVHLVAEGQTREVDAFLADVRERFSGNLRGERIDIGPATGEFAGFEIQH